jgi:chromatin remodeling complex protein RSC6
MARSANTKKQVEETQTPVQVPTPTPTPVENATQEKVQKKGKKKQTEETPVVPVVEQPAPVQVSAPVETKPKAKKEVAKVEVPPVVEVKQEQPASVPEKEEGELTVVDISQLWQEKQNLLKKIQKIDGELRQRFRARERELVRSQKILEKKKNKRSKKLAGDETAPKNNSGLTSSTPIRIADELADFLGVERGSMFPRRNANTAILAYIKENGLQEPTDKRFINPDEKLRKILHITDPTGKVGYFGLQKHIKHLFPKDV